MYNKVSGIPPVTLIVVNKRINQRIFIKDQHGDKVHNPPPGSIIDSNLVEHQKNNQCFDFFLVPQSTTQGCATPTHYFVTLNESNDLSKLDIENLTYAQCFMYSNWSGAIKVPAACQNAHKIAEYHSQFDAMSSKKGAKADRKQLNYNPNFAENLYFL